jgi:excisionase family DNA binding protein
MESDGRLLTAAEVAAMLAVPLPHVWRLARRGEIPVVRIGPRLIRFHPNDVELWINRRTSTRPKGTQ